MKVPTALHFVSGWLPLALAGLVVLPAPAAATNRGVNLTQVSDYFGEMDVIVADQGVRIKCKRFLAFMLAPDMRIVFYNPENKKYFKGTHADMVRMVRKRTPYRQRQKVEKVGVEEIGGIKAIKYRVSISSSRAKLGTRRLQEIWIARGFETPKPVSDAFAKFVDIPGGLGMPIKIVNYSPRTVRSLNTLKVKPITVTSSTFSGPENYKPVKSELELFMSDSDQEQIKDMLKDMTE